MKIEINSLTQANEVLQLADHETLVAFDLDDTLITPTREFYNYWKIVLGNPEEDFIQNDIAFVQQLQHNLKILTTNKNNITLHSVYGEKIASKILIKSNFRLTENCTLKIIKDLQARGVKLIALTFQKTGKYGEISCMQEWRVKKLLTVGLNFEQNFNNQEIVFNEFPMPHGQFPPMFYKGILMTAFNQKGPVLSAFLDHIKWVPSKIIFFDDSKAQIESIEQAINERNIPFHGYLYKGAKSQTPEPLNQSVVQLQFNHLNLYEEILSTDEAEVAIQKNNKN